jgi:hypothetical protein
MDGFSLSAKSRVQEEKTPAPGLKVTLTVTVKLSYAIQI